MSMVKITEKAAEEIKKILKEENKEGVGIRIFLAGFSCAGAQYGLAIEENPTENDESFEENGVRVYIDKQLGDVFKDAVLDYKVTEYGEGFIIENANIPESACGSSCSGCG